MAHLTSSVEYGIHCLLWLIDSSERPRSGRDLAEFQGISPTYVTKIFAKLQKAGIVCASEGIHGGYVLSRRPEQISVLQVIDAIEGQKPLFDCKEIRSRCPLFGEQPPEWATAGVCSVHVVMLKAEKAMRDTLASHSLADISHAVERKAPSDFFDLTNYWFDNRIESRGARKDITTEL